MSKTRLTVKSAVIIAIAAIVVFCIISVVFGVMPLDALPSNYIGAALGSLIGALITLVLLQGQTDIEEKKGKDIRILEQKTVVFQNYIQKVWAVWDDRNITAEEFQNLTADYYKNLMIYLDEKRLQCIGDSLSDIGKCIGKNEPGKLRNGIVAIINELSRELHLGGTINEKIMNAHDEIVFPVILRKTIVEALNKEIVQPDPELYKDGYWQEWNEGKNIHHDTVVFNFEKYRGCSIRIGLTEGRNDFLLFLFVPVGAKYHSFDKYRDTGALNQRIKLSDAKNLFNPLNQDDDQTTLSSFNFSEDRLKTIRETVNYREQADVLAKRVAQYVSNIQIDADGGMAIPEFLEKCYGGKVC